MKFKQAFFSSACFDFFDYFSRHLTNVSTFFMNFFTLAMLGPKNTLKMSRHSSCVEKYVEKIITST